MRDDRFHAGEIIIRRGIRRGKNRLRVENVQPFVLHRTHIKVINRNNVENVQVVFAPVDLFIPKHRGLQRGHAPSAAPFVTRPHPDVQRNLAARHRGEVIGKIHQIARHQRKQIGRLGPRIIPFCPSLALGDRIAVRQQHRQIALDPHLETGHHIGSVGVKGDLAKALGLALGAIHAVRHIKPLQRGIAFGRDLDLGFQHKGPRGQTRRRNRQARGIGHHVQDLAIHRARNQLQPLAIQPHILLAGAQRIGGHMQPRLHPRRRRIQMKA